jgi:hypothetical protein
MSQNGGMQMQTPTVEAEPEPIKRRKKASELIPPSQRAAHSLRQFAAMFGREQSWAYRRMYDGDIKVFKGPDGQFMVPHSEVERLLSQATTYTDEMAGEPVPRKKGKTLKGRAMNAAIK